METKNIKIGEFELGNSCDLDEIIEIKDSPSPVSLEDDKTSQYLSQENDDNKAEEVVINIQDEPIDLTFTKPAFLNNITHQMERNSENFNNTFPNSKDETIQTCKRTLKFFSCNDQEPSTSGCTFNTQSQAQVYTNPRKFQEPYACFGPNLDPLRVFSQLGSRQQEVLKMAKSFFSKRTRTLYHWIYPTASKQQVKQVVSNTWESMSPQEKGIYVAQVLTKFGYTSGDLMINPQLGQIKQLSVNPASQKFNAKATELQNAISSISKKSKNSEISDGRQSFKKQKMSSKAPAQNFPLEFEDDPELSKELAQFSVIFKDEL